MRVFVSVSKQPKVSRSEFDKFNAGQKSAYLKDYPHSSHGKPKKSKSQKSPSEEANAKPTKKTEVKSEKPKQAKTSTKTSKPKLKPLTTSNDKSLKRKIGESVFKGVKFKLNDITKALRSPKKDIMEAFNEPSTQKLLNAAGGTVKGLSKAALETLKLPNTVLGETFKELHKTKGFEKLQKGTMKVDKFLEKHPAIKKMGGALMAGAMIYQWLNMSFSGDFDDDFNIEHIGEALQGNYSVEDFVASPSGAKALTQLAAGIATGGMLSFPWHSGMNITFAALYTAAKKTGNDQLMKDAQSALKKAFKGKKK